MRAAVAVLSILACALPLAAEEKRPRVLVLDFAVASEALAEDDELHLALAVMVRSSLAETMEVVSKADLVRAAVQLEIQLDRVHTDPPSLGALASATGANLVLAGRVLCHHGRMWVCLTRQPVEQSNSQTVWKECGHVVDLLPETENLLRDLRLLGPRRPPVPASADQIATWIAQLEDPDNGVRFAAAVELGKRRSTVAVMPLTEVLARDRDTFVRRAAARSLGELLDLRAVPALIEAIQDREFFVAVTANRALKQITREDFGFSDGLSREQLQAVVERARIWWAENSRK